MSLSFHVVLILLLSTISTQVLAFSEYKKYSENLWDFEINSSYYMTDANYLRSGSTFENLPGGNSYTLMNFDFGARWSVTKSWAIYTEARVGVAESKDSQLNRSNSELNRVTVGTDFLLWDGPFKLTPDLFVVSPVGSNGKNSDSVQTSEGATELGGRLIAQFRLWRLYNQGFAGFTYRDGGRSSLLTYGLGTELDFGGWFLGGEVRGFASVIEDENTANPSTRETNPLRVNGGSYKFNTINPSLTEANAWFRYDNRIWGLQAGAGTSVTGTTSAAGYQFFINLIYHFQGQGSAKNAPRSDLERFQEETNDGVDQVLFAPQPTPTPAPKPEAKPINLRQKMQTDLDQTEVKIELKRKKKKQP